MHRTAGFEPQQMLDAFAHTADDFVALVRSLPAEAAELPVPGLVWNVAELVAHQYTVLRRGRDPRRAHTFEEMSRINQICVDEVATRELVALADLLQAEVAGTALTRRALPMLWRLRIGQWLMLRLHFGLESDLPMALTWPTTDMLIHGWELSKATGAPWTVNPARAAVCMQAAMPQTKTWIEPTVIEGPVRSHTISFGHDLPPLTLTVGEGNYEASVHANTPPQQATEVDPVQWLLHIMGRIGSTGDDVTDDVATWFRPI